MVKMAQIEYTAMHLILLRHILWLSFSNESLILLVEDGRGTGESERERERERMRANGRSGLWYRLVFQPVPKDVLGTG